MAGLGAQMGVHDERSTMELSANATLKLELSFMMDQLIEKTTATASTKPSERWAEFKQLFQLVENLRKTQPGPSWVASRVGGENFDPLLAWSAENGALCDKVEIGNFANLGNGIRAKEPIAADELVLGIPLKCMLSTATATAPKSKMKKLAAEDKMLTRMPNVLLSLHLLSELKSGKSFWKPYLDVLPATFSTPLYYTLKELELLRGSAALDEALTLLKNIVRQYVYLYKALKDPKISKQVGFSDKSFTFDDYRWAASAVMTRQNRVPVGGTDENPEFALALIPLWDLLNHSNGKLTTFHDCKAQRTEYNAMQSFNKGDQVLMFYGARTNAELLLHSGFVMEDNPHDYLLVKLGISTGDKLKELKCSLLDALQVPTSGDFVIGLDGEPEAPLNAFIRINSMTEEELQQHFETPQICATLGDKEGRVNDENETRACLFLEMRCKLLLRAYQSTVSADDALLTDTSQDQTYHASCAVRKRRSEMAILEACALVVAERGLEEEL